MSLKNEARLKKNLFKPTTIFQCPLFFVFWGDGYQADLCMASFFSSALHALPCFALDSCAFKQCSSDYFVAFRGLLLRKKNVSVEFRAPKLGKSALFWSRKVNFGTQVPMIRHHPTSEDPTIQCHPTSDNLMLMKTKKERAKERFWKVI